MAVGRDQRNQRLFASRDLQQSCAATNAVAAHASLMVSTIRNWRQFWRSDRGQLIRTRPEARNHLAPLSSRRNRLHKMSNYGNIRSTNERPLGLRFRAVFASSRGDCFVWWVVPAPPSRFAAHAPAMKGSSPRLPLGRHPQHQRLDFGAAVSRSIWRSRSRFFRGDCSGIAIFCINEQGLFVDRRSGRRCCVSLLEALFIDATDGIVGLVVACASRQKGMAHRPGTHAASRSLRCPLVPSLSKRRRRSAIFSPDAFFSSPYAAAKAVAVHGSWKVWQKLILAGPR